MDISDKILLEKLLRRYLDDLLNEEEAIQMHQLLQKNDAREILAGISVENIHPAHEVLSTVSWDLIWQNINQDLSSSRNITTVHRVHFLRKWGWAAASVILFIAATIFLVVSTQRSAETTKNSIAGTTEILPGKNGAILTLADGSQVLLDSIQNGVVGLQGGVTAKIVDGTLLYEGTGSEVTYNTMSTPKGRQFHLTLPDGTEVWLNSASSIRYPTLFAGNERKVDITGEAYFEVVKNKKMPFYINVNNTSEVEVLGTSFNVNAYENESGVNTTLLEGSINVRSKNNSKKILLKPGQQAIMPSFTHDKQIVKNEIKVVNNANINKVMAWKNGFFYFEGASLEEIMRQAERWYDIEVIYEKEVPEIEFVGEMTRGVSLNGFLIALKKSDVQYRLEGRKVIILP